MSVVGAFLAPMLLAFLFYFLLNRFLERSKNFPPGPTGVPIFGSLLSLVLDKREQYQVINGWTEKYGPIISFKLFNKRFHILADMALVKEAFQDSHDLSDRLTFSPADAISGKTNTSIVFSNGTDWRDLRRFFASVFRKIDTSVISFQKIVGDATECLIQEIEKAGGESVDPFLLVNISIANIITKIVTGVTYEYDNEELKGLVRTTGRHFDMMGTGGLVPMVPFLSKLPLPAVYEMKANYRKLHNFVKNAISRRLETFNPEDDQPTNFIECYLEEKAARSAQGSWTDLDNINFELTLLDTLIGGWETSTTALMWILSIMAALEEDQERVRDEIHAVVGDKRRPAYSDHRNLPFTEAVIMECSRFAPTVDFHLGHSAARDCKLGGYDVTEGDIVTTSLWYLAQSSKIWDRPEEFRPSRFLDSSTGALKRDLEPMPFGYGRRVCPGEQLARIELFTFLTYILQDFKLSLPDGASNIPAATHAFTNRPSPFKIHFAKIR